jgi:hypothetical protein
LFDAFCCVQAGPAMFVWAMRGAHCGCKFCICYVAVLECGPASPGFTAWFSFQFLTQKQTNFAGLAPPSSFFLLRCQKKEAKEKATRSTAKPRPSRTTQGAAGTCGALTSRRCGQPTA